MGGLSLMLAVALFARIFLLVVFATVIGVCVWSYQYGRANGPMADGCTKRPGVIAVRVPGRDVAYARRQGWPVVMSRGDRLGFAAALDHSGAAVRVRDRTAGFCRSQRFRLVASS